MPELGLFFENYLCSGSVWQFFIVQFATVSYYQLLIPISLAEKLAKIRLPKSFCF